MQQQGHIRLLRSFKDWRYYSDPSTCRLYEHFLISANFAPTDYLGITLDRGQYYASLSEISGETGLSKQQIRTSLHKLIAVGEISTKQTLGKTLVTICNYDSYIDDQHDTNTETTQEQHDANTGATRPLYMYNKNDKNDKNEKNDKKETGGGILRKSYASCSTVEQRIAYERHFLTEHNVQADTPLFSAIMEWLQYHRDIKKPYKSDLSLNRLLGEIKKYSGGKTEAAIEVINQSIANNWQGLFELKQNKQTTKQDITADGVKLGYNERVVTKDDGTQYRTYGDSGAVVPMDAPPRPGWDYQWDCESNLWFRC